MMRVSILGVVLLSTFAASVLSSAQNVPSNVTQSANQSSTNPTPSVAAGDAVEKNLEAITGQMNDLSAQEVKLKEEMRKEVMGFRDVDKIAREKDAELAQMMKRMTALEDELKQLRQQVRQRMESLPEVKERQTRLEAIRTQLSALSKKRMDLMGERARVMRERWSLQEKKEAGQRLPGEPAPSTNSPKSITQPQP